MIGKWKKGKNQKRKLTRRIRSLTIQLSGIGLISIIFLMLCFSYFTNSYSQIVNENYHDIQSMNALNQSLYKHQTLLLEHMTTSAVDKKGELKNQAKDLGDQLMEGLNQFGKSMNGQKHESYYHSIYSGIVGYLKDTEVIFRFSENGQVETANYYMENIMSDYIVAVNQNMKILDERIKGDMETARDDLEHHTSLVRKTSIVLVCILMVYFIAAYITCVHVSEEMINVDAITRIANYDKFLEFGERKFRMKSLLNYTVVLINIKSFQYINQQYGSDTSDLILAKYARYLAEQTDKNELLARMSGDSFVAWIEKDNLKDFLKRISKISVEVTTEKGKQSVTLQARCGVYVLENNIDVQSAIDCAVTALKHSRDVGSTDVVWYSEEMADSDIAMKEVIVKFQKAIEEKEFIVYYQPKVDMKTNHLCGCEALVRWRNQGKVVPPVEFIPILEEKGYIVELDFYVFEQVCADIAQWIKKGITPVRISSNFSKLHLKDKNFADKLLALIGKYQVDPKYIEIELTESFGFEDFGAMEKFVNRMHAENIHTAIDDFGTGYSSLSMLKDLEIDVVKLDKSFLEGIEEGIKEKEKLVENIVRMIMDLNRSVICEGVETEKEADFLKSVDCYMAQGYLYDRPLPHDEFEERLVHPVYLREG